MAVISGLQRPHTPPGTQSVDAQSTEQDEEGEGFKPFTGHDNAIHDITYSPDGKLIATASYDHTIRIWDVNSGRQVGGTMHEHTNIVNGISYSPDGKFLVSCSHDGTAHVWDTTGAGNAPVQTAERVEGQIWAVKYSPDGNLIASDANNGRLKIWDARKQAFKYEYGEDSGIIYSIAWEPSGKRLATGCTDSKVRVFDLTKPGVVVLLVEGHRDEVRSVMYSPDGKLLASGGADRSVRLWDAQTGKAVKSPLRGHRDRVDSVAWSPASTRIISGSADRTVRVWDVSSSQTLFKGPLHAHGHRIWCVSYSPDGKSFASADSGTTPRVQIWDAHTGKPSLPRLSDGEHSDLKKAAQSRYVADDRSSEAGKMKAGASVLAVEWFPDGHRFATAGEEPLVRIWSARTGLQVSEIVGHRETVNALSISTDGTKLASASDDHTVLLFDTGSMQPLREPLIGHDEAVYSVKLTPDGSRVISGGKDKTVRFWDTLTGKAQHVSDAHTDSVRALSVTKDGEKLASGGDDNSIYVWNTRTYERLGGPFKHDGSVRTLSFSPDGLRLMSGSEDFTVRVWDAATGNPAFDPIRVHTGPIGAVDWSPDGKKLLTAGAHDWTIWIWDASKGKRLLGPLEDHEDGIRAAAFSPDGKRFVSGSMDHTLRMWDTSAGVVQKYEEAESQSTQAETSKRDGVRRQQSIDESIMNMPATIGGRRAASTSRAFWDGADLDGPSGRQRKSTTDRKNKEDVQKSQHSPNVLKRIWQRRTIQSISNIKGKGRDPGSSCADAVDHAMVRMPMPPAVEVSAAHDKLRVFVAGDDPRARFRSQAEPESDEERKSPTGSTDPNQPGANSDSDDESEHGLVDTICFCLCLPCCK